MNMTTKLICVLASFYLITLCAPGAYGGERIYDFNNADAADAWEPIEAEWEIIDGEYVVTDPDSSRAGIAVLKESEEIDTSDVESIEFMGYDLGTGPWQNMFIVFGFDERNPVTYGIGPFVGSAQAWRLLPFDSRTRIYPAGDWDNPLVARKNEALGPGKWYHVKLEFDGDTVILYGAEADGDLEEKLSYEFPDGKPSGRIGIGGFGSNVKFDDFRVTGPGVKSLAAVEPKDKLPVAWAKIKAGFGS